MFCRADHSHDGHNGKTGTKQHNDPDGPSRHRILYAALALFCIFAIPLLGGIVMLSPEDLHQGKTYTA
jgi:hypothetical protein